jgi:hypothetical protein
MLIAGVRRRDAGLVEGAVDLAVPPLAFLVVIEGVGAAGTVAAAALGFAPYGAVVPWLLALTALGAYVLIGLRAADAPRASYAALATAPLYLLWKLRVYLQMLRGFDPNRWVRTARSAGGPEAGS